MHQKLPLLMQVAIAPKTAADSDKLAAALEQLTTKSSRLDTTIDSESGLTVLRGTGEATLEEACAQLHDLNIQFDVGAPEVAYRETIRRSITIEHIHKKIYGPKGEFALV